MLDLNVLRSQPGTIRDRSFAGFSIPYVVGASAANVVPGTVRSPSADLLCVLDRNRAVRRTSPITRTIGKSGKRGTGSWRRSGSWRFWSGDWTACRATASPVDSTTRIQTDLLPIDYVHGNNRQIDVQSAFSRLSLGSHSTFPDTCMLPLPTGL